MHTLTLKSSFIAQHFLIGKEFGPENDKHSHHYTCELEIEGRHLDQFNFLIDIVDVRQNLDKLIAEYNDKTLNDLPEFLDQNPSLELFSKILWQKFKEKFNLPANCNFTIKLWEDTIAQASYRGQS